MTTLNLTPEPSDELVRLVSYQGASELNIGTSRYVPDARGAFWVERSKITHDILNVGGFVVKPLSKKEAMQDVGRAIDLMPTCAEKVALVAALAGIFESVERPE
jgi:hypothetical protein